MPAPPAGVKKVLGLAALFIWANDVLGPLTTVHAPVPDVGVFAANVADAVVHTFWSVPAFDAVGFCTTVTGTLTQLVAAQLVPVPGL